MDNIFKRFTCLMLALLMVLEVFSPLAVSAKSLFDEEENQNSIMSEPKVDDKSILGQERTKPKKAQAEDDLFSVPGVKKKKIVKEQKIFKKHQQGKKSHQY